MEDRTQNIHATYFEDEMKTSYLNYAYSVITSRAIPDARDGLKPVHRRILHSMAELALWPDKQTRKSARVVGDVLGKYHPHGDSSVYMAIVKMIQNFSIRYPLIIGQGNFGSMDDDPPAAMRYTEVKLSPIAKYILEDIKKDTVDFQPNFDETLKEPVIMPGKFPNLLCNGTTGIAVGFATSIPPHNFTEVTKAIQAYIKDPDISIKKLLEYVKGPDFPTSGIILNQKDFYDIYSTGHGSFDIAAKIDYVEEKNKRQLIISQIPYRVIKAKIVEEITHLIVDNKNKYALILSGVKEVRDESSKDEVRVVIDLAPEVDAQAVKTILYKQTSLKTRFSMNMVALVNGRPKKMNLKDALIAYVEHRREVIIRRTNFELRKAQDRLHIIEGLLIALASIDEVIKVIKSSKNAEEARQNLRENFILSEVQAQAILDMRLQKLTSLEVEKLKEEKAELEKIIEELLSILKDSQKRDKILIDELLEIKAAIKDERKTSFGSIEVEKIEREELIEDEMMTLNVSKKGFLIREIGITNEVSSRGSKGTRKQAVDMKRILNGDQLLTCISGSVKDTILFVSDVGRVYSIKGYEITGDRDGKMTFSHIRNIARLQRLEENGEKITNAFFVKDFDLNHFFLFATKKGQVVRTSMDQFQNILRTGINGITLNKGDAVVSVEVTEGNGKFFFVKKNAKGFILAEPLFPTAGRGAKGTKATSVTNEAEELLGMGIVDPSAKLLLLSEDGRGRMVPFSEISELQNRGAKGYKLANMGKDRILSCFALVHQDDKITINTFAGKRITILEKDISEYLLKLVDLKAGDHVYAVSVEKDCKDDKEEN